MLKPRMPARGPGLAATCGMAFLCVAVFTGFTSAQSKPTGSEPKPEPASKAEPKAAPETAPKVEPVPDAQPSPEAKEPSSKAKAARRQTKGRGDDSAFKMNPNAKWVCNQPTRTLPPAWRGKDTLTFDFDIQNAGTEELLIKAKGG